MSVLGTSLPRHVTHFPTFRLPDALLVAVQSAGETATAEMVHAVNGPGEEEGYPGHDDDGVGPSTTFLQLPPMEGPQDSLQKVAARDTTALSFLLSLPVRFCFF